jgi:[ribosomal protein S5]-alanine N-acetyltransferase
METKNLSLIPCTIPHLEKLIESAEAFEAAFGWRVIEGYIEFDGALEYLLGTLKSEDSNSEWPSYFFIHRADKALIGLGGYKGEPDENGSVEIGYGVAPAYRGKGYATEAAEAMIQNAFASDDVQMVCAHTLAEENHSVAILRKLGMEKVAEINDPEDGNIWRWEVNYVPPKGGSFIGASETRL